MMPGDNLAYLRARSGVSGGNILQPESLQEVDDGALAGAHELGSVLTHGC